ncbi:MAG: hypothetical protein ACLQGV_05260 [Bryobacteraceae bacterium]
MRPLSARLKIIAVAIVLCLGAGVGWMLYMRPPGRIITDRELLQEAAAECQRAGEFRGQLGYEVFEQQAAQGYYDDAAATAHLFWGWPAEMRWSGVEIARIRAENGDLQGAKAIVKRFAGSDLGRKAAEAVAFAQACKGDLAGALETAASGVDREGTLEAFARRQIANGEFAAALETAAKMKSPNQVFYELGSALWGPGEQKRVRELASGMRDRKLAAEFAKAVQLTLSSPPVRGGEAGDAL